MKNDNEIFIYKDDIVSVTRRINMESEIEVKEARLAENAIRERIKDEEEGIATLMRRKRRHTYHYNDDKTCELCSYCKRKETYGYDVYCEIDNQVINLEDPACNSFKDKW